MYRNTGAFLANVGSLSVSVLTSPSHTMFLAQELPFEDKEQRSWGCLLQVLSCLFQHLTHLQTEVTNPNTTCPVFCLVLLVVVPPPPHF